jgi:hypothetical protein
MKLGAWIHNAGDLDESAIRAQFVAAGAAGLGSVRSYTVGYTEQIAPWVKDAGMSVLAGIHVDEHALVDDWKSQVKLDELERTIAVDCPIEAICVGNELREGGDAWNEKRFTPRLSFNLARVLDAYHDWMAKNGVGAPLTYAMEGIVFGENGRFRDYVWPLIDSLDIVSLNHYPMTVAHWHDFSAFEVSKRFLTEERPWRLQMAGYEAHLRRTLEALEPAAKPIMLSEMGFPSGVDYRIEGTIKGNDHVWPISDTDAFSRRMNEYVEILASANRDYADRILALYWYEWWDNHYHGKIWNIEQSPIHTCFGLCDHEGTPKLDIPALVRRARGG